MHVGYEIHRCVVFIGFRNQASPIGFTPVGTGLLVAHGGAGYLVSARHVVEPLSGTPHALRVNREDRAHIIDGERVEWTYHPDASVDLAAVPLHLTQQQGFEALYQRTDLFVPDSWIERDKEGRVTIAPGDLCYTVGLFRFIQGTSKNLPMVHAGNIAALPPVGEKIPVRGRDHKIEKVEGYLVESHSIDGASGSPVVVRRTITVRDIKTDDGETINAHWPEAAIKVLGLYQGAWFRPPDDVLKDTVNAAPGEVVPVGVGIVIPARKIVELLETEPMRKYREKRDAAIAAQLTARNAITPNVEPEPPTTVDNP